MRRKEEAHLDATDMSTSEKTVTLTPRLIYRLEWIGQKLRRKGWNSRLYYYSSRNVESAFKASVAEAGSFAVCSWSRLSFWLLDDHIWFLSSASCIVAALKCSSNEQLGLRLRNSLILKEYEVHCNSPPEMHDIVREANFQIMKEFIVKLLIWMFA